LKKTTNPGNNLESYLALLFILSAFRFILAAWCLDHLLHGSAKQSGKGVLVLDRKRQSLPPPYSKTPS